MKAIARYVSPVTDVIIIQNAAVSRVPRHDRIAGCRKPSSDNISYRGSMAFSFQANKFPIQRGSVVKVS